MQHNVEESSLHLPGQMALEDVTRSWRWFGHNGWTELCAIHPEYRPSEVQWNAEHGTFARVWYARDEAQVVRFVDRYVPERLVCYSLNPRPGILRNRRGYARSAREDEIETSQNLLLDFDFKGGVPTQEQTGRFEAFLDEQVDAYFRDHGFLAPVRAFTGRGFHVLVAYAPIRVADLPDIKVRLRTFRDELDGAFRQELGHLEAVLDKTQDLRRVVRVYGTPKPSVGIVSRFYGGERVEDEAFRDYLIGLEVPCAQSGSYVIRSNEELPAWFEELLRRDRVAAGLWQGTGKPDGTDQSASGFDYSLARHLLRRGYTDVAQLATILTLRPAGSAQRSGKDEKYVLRTIAAALVR